MNNKRSSLKPHKVKVIITDTDLQVQVKCDGKLLSLFKHAFVQESAESGNN